MGCIYWGRRQQIPKNKLIILWQEEYVLQKVRQGKRSERKMGHVLVYTGWTNEVVLKHWHEWSEGESHGAVGEHCWQQGQGPWGECAACDQWRGGQGERGGEQGTCPGATSRWTLEALCGHLGSKWWLEHLEDINCLIFMTCSALKGCYMDHKLWGSVSSVGSVLPLTLWGMMVAWTRGGGSGGWETVRLLELVNVGHMQKKRTKDDF